MGIDYNIIFARGLLIRNNRKKNLKIPSCLFDYPNYNTYTDGGYTPPYVPNNIFIAPSKINNFYLGCYDEKWVNQGITNFLGDDKNNYDENNMEQYIDKLMEIYQKNKNPMVIQFCRINDKNLPEEAHLLFKLSDDEKEYEIMSIMENFNEDYPEEDYYDLNEFLNSGVYGDVLMKIYT